VTTLILTGIPASMGVVSGPVKVVTDLSMLSSIESGDILVTGMASPDMILAMRKVVGIITDRGGATCHAASVARELGIPCIVGTNNATKILPNGGRIIMDGTTGEVYEAPEYTHNEKEGQ